MRAIATRIHHLLAAYPRYCSHCKCITHTLPGGYCEICKNSK